VDGAIRYWAFLSYSHDDRRVAGRLHRALEGYRVPARLAGRQGSLGRVPSRLHPIFRDRDELTASGHIGAVVEAALAASRTLIVLCSPASARSPWVDSEIATFHRLQPDAPVLCVLLDGEPRGTGEAGTPQCECLPPSLRARFDSGVGVADAAPVAVDLRPQGDGWRLGVQKLVAGIAGVPLDQLVQRDAQRRNLRLAALSVVLAVVSIAMGSLALLATRARDDAGTRRAQAEGLVEFMLGDLRGKLEPVGRLDALDAVATRALRYYDSQQPSTLDADALGRRSRALHMIGDLRDRRGDRRGALEAFLRARDTTAELLQRAPDDPQRIYDQAQSVFWVGYASDWQAGKSAQAEQAFLDYQKLARRLVALDPSNAQWQGELAYSHGNLGTLLLDLGRAREALTQFEMSRRVDVGRVDRQPQDVPTLLDLGQDYSWMSTAALLDLQIDQAIALRRREIALYEGILGRDPRNALTLGRLLVARRFLAEALVDAGDLVAAQRELDAAQRMARAQRHLDPANTEWLQAEAKGSLLQASMHGWEGDPQQGLHDLATARPLLADLLHRDPNAWAWKVELQEGFAQAEADLLREAARPEDAVRVIAASVQRLRAVMRDPQQAEKTRRWLTLSEGRFARLLADTHDREQADRVWRALATRDGAGADIDTALWLLRAHDAVGDEAAAHRLRETLVRAGYRHPDFDPADGAIELANQGP
jgi:hypothetical protein